MNSSLRLCMFSPLRTPDVIAAKSKAVKFKHSQRLLAPEASLSDVESVASVTTRDIRSIAKSVGERMTGRNGLESSDEDLFITQVFKSPSKSKHKGTEILNNVKSNIKPSDKPVSQPDEDSDSGSSSSITDSSDSESGSEQVKKSNKSNKSATSSKSNVTEKQAVVELKPGKKGIAGKPAYNKELNGKSKKGITTSVPKQNHKQRTGSESEESDDTSEAESVIIPVASPLKVKRDIFKDAKKGGKSKGDNSIQSKEQNKVFPPAKYVKAYDGKTVNVSGSISDIFGHTGSSSSDSNSESEKETIVMKTKQDNGKGKHNAASAVSDSDDSNLTSDTDDEKVPKKAADTKTVKSIGKQIESRKNKNISGSKTVKAHPVSSESSSDEETKASNAEIKMSGKKVVKKASSKAVDSDSDDSLPSSESEEEDSSRKILKSNIADSKLKKKNSPKKSILTSQNGKINKHSVSCKSSSDGESEKNVAKGVNDDSDSDDTDLSSSDETPARKAVKSGDVNSSTAKLHSPSKTATRSGEKEREQNISSSDEQTESSSDEENNETATAKKDDLKDRSAESTNSESDSHDSGQESETNESNKRNQLDHRDEKLKTIQRKHSGKESNNAQSNKRKNRASSSSSEDSDISPPVKKKIKSSSSDSDNSVKASESDSKDALASSSIVQSSKINHIISSSDSSDEETKITKKKVDKSSVKAASNKAVASPSASDDSDQTSDTDGEADSRNQSFQKLSVKAVPKSHKISPSSKTKDRTSSSSSDSDSSEPVKKETNKVNKGKDMESASSAGDSDNSVSTNGEDIKFTAIKKASPKKVISSSIPSRRKHSVSSLSSSDEDTEKRKRKDEKTKVKAAGSKTIVSSYASDESDHSSGDDSETAARNQILKKSKKADSKSQNRKRTKGSSDEESDVNQPEDEQHDAGKHKQLRFETPKNFEVKMVEDIVARSSLEGKQIFLISTPSDFDVSVLDNQTINLSGENIVTGKKSDKQYEVSCLPAAQDHTTSLCTVASESDQGNDSLVIGPEVSGQILVMNWIPKIPPVVLQRPEKFKHQIPEDLRPHFAPFGSSSPPRTHIHSTTLKSHKKKAKKRRKESFESETFIPTKKGTLSIDSATKAVKTEEKGATDEKSSEKKKKKKHKKHKAEGF